jgi:hypothetical protein
LSSGIALYSITWGNGLFAGVGDSGAIITSPDGTNWVAQNSMNTNTFNGIAFGNGRFVAVGDGFSLYSTDGTNWFQALSAITNSMFWVAFGGDYFVAVGENGAIMTSSDGIHWTSDNSGTTNWLYGVAYCQNGQFLAVGDAGTILLHSGLRILALQRAPGGMLQFQVNGLNGATAIIEAATSLMPANWQPIATNPIVNSTVTFSDSTRNLPSRYYRARLQ